jgi:hypothetical protein
VSAGRAEKDPHERAISVTMIAAALVGWLLLIGITYRVRDLYVGAAPFLAPTGVEFAAHVIFLLDCIASLVYLSKAWHSGRRWQALVPLAINLLTIVGWMHIPFLQIKISIDYHTNRAERERVVADVLSGVLQPTATYTPGYSLIDVPSGYGQVSKGSGNKITVEQEGGHTSISFFLFQNDGNSYGFAYRTDSSPPTRWPVGGDFTRLTQLDAHWYRFSVVCLTCEVADLMVPGR